MVLPGGGSCDPFGDVIIIDFSVDEPFGRFPSFFQRLYPDEVPMNVVLVDPLGNVNNVHVEKIGSHCYFTDGWAHFGRVYGIVDGAYVCLVYVGSSRFEVSIRTYKWVEWIYPPIPEPLEGGFGAAGINMNASWQEQLLLANNGLFPFLLVKYVSFSEFTGDTMTLPPGFFDAALINPGAEMFIVDEYGKRWPCFFRRGYGSHSDIGVVTKGWARFCRRKGLQQGQKIMFGVTCAKSNNLHFIPIPNA